MVLPVVFLKRALLFISNLIPKEMGASQPGSPLSREHVVGPVRALKILLGLL